MRLVHHPDPLALESALLRRLDETHPRDRAGATCVVVPTRRLADRLQERLLELRDAWLGLEIVHLRALAARVLAAAGRPVPASLAPRLRREALRLALDRLGEDHPWSAIARRRPGTVARLAATFRELREAGVPARALARAGRDGLVHPGLPDVYAAYESVLAAAASRGAVDDAELARLAASAAKPYAAAHGAILVHGFYEWTGTAHALLAALDATRELEVFLPLDAGAPAYRYAEAFADALGPAVSRRDRAADPDGPRPEWAALFDESARPRPAGGGFALDGAHAQGPTAEFRRAALSALDAIERSDGAARVAIVARSLEPYAPAIEEVLEELGLETAVETSLSGPLRRHPAVRDALETLRLLDENFPRRATCAWLRSPRIRWEALLPGGARPDGDLAERWSRAAGIVRGLADWRTELPAEAHAAAVRRAGEQDEAVVAERAAQAEERALRIVSALEALHARFDRSDASPAEWARRFGACFDDLLPADTGPARALKALLGELAAVETLLGATRAIPFEAARARLAAAVDGTALPAPSASGGRLAVLDAMQARGRTFDRVFLLGANAGLFPRPAREDPFVPDAARARLGRDGALPLPLPRKSDSVHEERLLLAVSLAAARTAARVSWQRADDAGRSRPPSLALREIARLALGAPSLEEFRDAAHAIPSHPEQAIADALERTALAQPSDLRLLDALRSREDGLAALAARHPELAPGCAQLEAVQAFAFPAGAAAAEASRFDGRVGPVDLDRAWSVSALQTLGTCPLQFFFDSVLGARALDPETDPFAPDAREIGNEIHATLERLYAALRDLPPGADARAEADRRLDEEGAAALGRIGRRLSGRWPQLGEPLARRWVDALRAFVARDLERLGPDAPRAIERLEHLVAGELDLTDGPPLAVRGRVDRIVRVAERRWVGDYKTTRRAQKLQDHVNPTDMLHGDRLQAPLYARLTGGAAVEFLGVGPTFDGPAAHPDEAGPVAGRATFEGFAIDEDAEGFEATLRTLIGLLREGRFPLRADGHCRFCDHRDGCRRTHPPTLAREETAPDVEDYRAARARKASRKKPPPARARRKRKGKR